MIALVPLSDPHPDDHHAALVEFRVDPDAEPGNVLPALARLLLDLTRRRKEKEGNHQ